MATRATLNPYILDVRSEWYDEEHTTTFGDIFTEEEMVEWKLKQLTKAEVQANYEDECAYCEIAYTQPWYSATTLAGKDKTETKWWHHKGRYLLIIIVLTIIAWAFQPRAIVVGDGCMVASSSVAEVLEWAQEEIPFALEGEKILIASFSNTMYELNGTYNENIMVYAELVREWRTSDIEQRIRMIVEWERGM